METQAERNFTEDSRQSEGFIRIERGRPEQFMNQSNGLYDRYLGRGEGGRVNTLMEFWPVGSQNFRPAKDGSVVWVDIQNMPWYVAGWLNEGFSGHKMRTALDGILNPRLMRLAQNSETTQTATGSQLIFDKTVWDHTMLEIRQELMAALIAERPSGASSHLYALGLNRSPNMDNMNVYHNNIRFVNDGVYGHLEIPKMDQRSMSNFLRQGGWFDIKLRFLVDWLFCRIFPGHEANGIEVRRTSIVLRLLGPEAIKNIVSKMSMSMHGDFMDAEVAAAMGIFQEAAELLFENDEAWKLSAETSKISIRTTNIGHVSSMSNGENVEKYFGGSTALAGSGTADYAWLIEGMRCMYSGDGDLDFCFISPIENVQGLPNTGVIDEFTVEREIAMQPFVVGSPTLEESGMMTYFEEKGEHADGFPFRAIPHGGIINNVQMSYYDVRPNEKLIAIPHIVLTPRYAPSPRGFREALRGGNLSVLKGDTALPATTWTLSETGHWSR
jgi:hypothetical protein